MTAQSVVEPSRPVWAAWPASRASFLLLAFLILAYAATLDRTFLSDHQNYVEYFRESTLLDSAEEVPQTQSLVQFVVVQLFSEELLWRVWADVLGVVLDPEQAVLATVLLLNLLVVASAWRADGPVFSLVLWTILPVGFAVIGLLQLRQGFAFAVMLFGAMYMRRPGLGLLVSGMIHTTFAVAYGFSLIGWILRARQRLALAAVLALAFAGAYLGGVLFDMFGGRRLLQYSIGEGATSINYVIGGAIAMVPSVYWLLVTGKDALAERYVISNLALVHVGTTSFTLFSFFLFPIGAGRVGYFQQLLLIPILPAILRRGRGMWPLAVVAPVTLFLAYLAAKAYFEGTYDFLLHV